MNRNLFKKFRCARQSVLNKIVAQRYLNDCRKCRTVDILNMSFVEYAKHEWLSDLTVNMTGCFQERLYRDYLQQSVGAHDFDAVKF